MDIVVDLDFVDVVRVFGVVLYKLWKGREKIVNRWKGVRRVLEVIKDNYVVEVKIMFEMVCFVEEKIFLLLGLKILDEGKLI